jgi:RHS repeat-associated protein
MEDDGRIIIYKSAWSSGTSGHFYGTALAHPGCDVGNSGLGSTGVLWAGSCIVSPNGHFELLMQTDGNLVIYDRSVTPNAVLWSTGTATSPADPGVAMRTLYSYGPLGNLLRVEQHGDTTDSTKWRIRTFTYDSLSRLLTATNPESGTISYSYDSDGNMITKTDARGIMISYIYDPLHRLVTKTYSDGSPSSQYNYDNVAWWPSTNAIGRLVEIYNGASDSAYFNYDALGRVVSHTRYWAGGGGTVNASYDLAGDLTQLTYPNGEVVKYTPDSAGRIVSAVDNGNGINFVTGATYGPDNSLTGFVSGSGGPTAITNSFSYNQRLQPLAMSASSPSQTVFSIGYDFHVGNGTSGADNGNAFGITNYKDTTRSQTFAYDALNRLTSAQNAGTNCAATTVNGKTEYWGNSYGYDAWGNLLQKSVTKCSAEYLSVAALVNNRLSGYSYDAAGNMTNDGLGNAFTFDAESRIAQVNSGAVNYVYDGDGNRVRKDVSGQASTEYYYFGGNIIAEVNISTSGWTNYVFLNGERVARKDSTGVFYYFSDHLKTASVITDSAGIIKSESDYYPWGGEIQFVANDSNHYKFTGKERDSETQLDYFGARYYSNGLGRFVTPDWAAKATAVPYAEFADPQSLNLYSYVRNVPTSKADADGHCPWCPALAGGGILADEAPLAASGPVGWTIIGVTAVSVIGYAAYQHFHSNSGNNTPPPPPPPSDQTGNKSSPAPQSNPAPGTATQTPKDVYIDPAKYPASAGHAADAIKAGQPDVLTVNRPGADANRAAATAGHPTQPTTDRDEYPPAVTAEGGAGASVKNIPSSDNRGAGGSLGQQIKDVPNGGQIKVNIGPKSQE